MPTAFVIENCAVNRGFLHQLRNQTLIMIRSVAPTLVSVECYCEIAHWYVCVVTSNLQLHVDPGQLTVILTQAGHIGGGWAEATSNTTTVNPADITNKPRKIDRRKYLFIFPSTNLAQSGLRTKPLA